MTTKMLIDAAHPEETRVVVLRGNKVEEFDFESANRLPLRGNIYLAKVTRVEPSLQAAFVDFGGNRHGFLAFSEIHPDYYQIPTADRLALLEEEAQAARDEEAEDDARAARPQRQHSRAKRNAEKDVVKTSPPIDGEEGDALDGPQNAEADLQAYSQANGEQDPEVAQTASTLDEADEAPEFRGEIETVPEQEGEGQIEQLGAGSDAMEEVPTRTPYRTRKQYKIQEVIRRRQILLVQVVKEERGNKGAALTTYLSLAGRYSVLMPNTARGGGISRKITNAVDRKRLKAMAQELEVQDGMGIILRTAGATRTKVEIKRDFEYLMRLWESVRELTLQSTAPALVYEEGSLIKRAIRDLYTKDIEEIHVAGDDGYREAKNFMRMLMPSHAKVVQPYKDATPLFSRLGVETQLDAMFSNVITLKSGGYIVINQTEALVAVDVNSGRSTREHNIEDTALKTNLEAAEEVARQLRLRDLAGLIVIDFIDMEEGRNNKAVERKLNDCLKNDRARIQVGRISPFGLLEMSRQRIRTGVLESSTTPCPHCAGTGLLRSTPSLALHVLRALEDTLLRDAHHNITLRTRLETAFYILNQKRESLSALEARFGVMVNVVAEATLPPGQHFMLERGELATPRFYAQVLGLAPAGDAVEEGSAPSRPAIPGGRAIHVDDINMDDVIDEEFEEAEEAGEEAEGDTKDGETGEERNKRRRRRRRGGRGRKDGGEARDPAAAQAGEEAQGSAEDEDSTAEGEDDSDPATASTETAEEKRRRRRRRGGRRHRRDREPRGERGDRLSEEGEPQQALTVPAETVSEQAPLGESPEPRDDKPRRAPRRKKGEDAPSQEASGAQEEPSPKDAAQDSVETAVTKPARPSRARKAAASADDEGSVKTQPDSAPAASAPIPPPTTSIHAPLPEPEPDDPNRPKRSGWWAKAKKVIGG